MVGIGSHDGLESLAKFLKKDVNVHTYIYILTSHFLNRISIS